MKYSKFVSFIMVATIFTFLSPSAVMAFSNSDVKNLEGYVKERDKNPNVIVLTGDLVNELETKIDKKLNQSKGMKFQKEKRNSVNGTEVVYSFNKLDRKKADIVTKMIIDDRSPKGSAGISADISTQSATYGGGNICASYHDYIFWGGSYLKICGRHNQYYVSRLSRFAWGNDDITSIFHTHSQIYSRLYEHDNYRGRTFDADWDRYFVGGLNNRASSLKVWFP